MLNPHSRTTRVVLCALLLSFLFTRRVWRHDPSEGVASGVGSPFPGGTAASITGMSNYSVANVTTGHSFRSNIAKHMYDAVQKAEKAIHDEV